MKKADVKPQELAQCFVRQTIRDSDGMEGD